jgi:hypothetical protein
MHTKGYLGILLIRSIDFCTWPLRLTECIHTALRQRFRAHRAHFCPVLQYPKMHRKLLSCLSHLGCHSVAQDSTQLSKTSAKLFDTVCSASTATIACPAQNKVIGPHATHLCKHVLSLRFNAVEHMEACACTYNSAFQVFSEHRLWACCTA